MAKNQFSALAVNIVIVAKEYAVRFYSTEEIDPENYPFSKDQLRPGHFKPVLAYLESPLRPILHNSNGRVMDIDPETEEAIWATAKITERPERWCVDIKNWEEDSIRILQEYFNYTRKEKDFPNIKNVTKDLGNVFTDKLEVKFALDDVSSRQYLTEKQWMKLIGSPFYLMPKVGDYGIFYEDKNDLIETLNRGDYVINKIIGIGMDGRYHSNRNETTYFAKIDIEKPLKEQIDNFLIK